MKLKCDQMPDKNSAMRITLARTINSSTSYSAADTQNYDNDSVHGHKSFNDAGNTGSDNNTNTGRSSNESS